MKKPRTLIASASMVPVVGILVLAGVFSNPHPALAACPLPPGVTPPPDPPATAQQVEDGSANLMDFALAARDQFIQGVTTAEEAFYIGCLLRHEGSPWRSGSTYLVQLTPDRIFFHAKAMALSGRLLNPIDLWSDPSSIGNQPGRPAGRPWRGAGRLRRRRRRGWRPVQCPRYPGRFRLCHGIYLGQFPGPHRAAGRIRSQ